MQSLLRLLLILPGALCLMALPAQAFDIKGITSTPITGGERVSVLFSEDAEVEVSLAEQNPPRVIIDMPRAHWRAKKKNYHSDLIKSFKLSRHNEDTSRLMLNLNGPVKLSNVQMDGTRKKGYWLELDIIPLPAGKKRKVEQFQPKEKPVIIIDAGHGGQDPGTSGVGGVKEKRITLAFAKALEQELLSRGHYRVVLTRKDDTYLFLRERVKLAREAKGNLFISIHADSAPSKTAYGLSVYTISEKASDKEAEALANKENKADIIGGMDLSATSQDVADILIDLAERETRGKSAQFAKLVIRRLARDIALLSNTHRFAGFAVLKAPDIPSILVEVGFLSSLKEERQLESEVYRQKVAGGIADAVDTYFLKRRK